MKIRSSAMKCSSASFPSPSSSQSQTSASSSSSPNPPSILPHSFDLSENPSSPSSSCLNSTARCEGLDLLVMAVHYLAGSIVGVPFAQKRVVRRRKRAAKFNNLIVSGMFCGKEDEKRECKEDPDFGFESKPTREKRVMALPTKFRDSVLQPWKRRNRSRSIGGRSSQQVSHALSGIFDFEGFACEGTCCTGHVATDIATFPVVTFQILGTSTFSRKIDSIKILNST